MSTKVIKIEFEVQEDESGGFNAGAEVGAHSLITHGANLDELRAAVQELVELFTENSQIEVESFSLTFSNTPVAA